MLKELSQIMIIGGCQDDQSPDDRVTSVIKEEKTDEQRIAASIQITGMEGKTDATVLFVRVRDYKQHKREETGHGTLAGLRYPWLEISGEQIQRIRWENAPQRCRESGEQRSGGSPYPGFAS